MRLFFVILFTCTLGAAPPKAVIFDYGGVMAEVDRKPLLDFLESTLMIPHKKLKKDFARDRLYEILDEPLSFWHSYAKCELSPNWKADLGKKKREVVRPIAGMSALVEELKASGFQVALLSNTDKARSIFLKRLGGYRPFQSIILSCDVGVKKPDPKIFDISLKELSLDASDCLFIDDKVQNIDAAKKRGIDGIVFVSREHLIEELKKRGIVFK